MVRRLKKNQYQCAMCKGVFVKGWSDEEARAEFESDFPTVLFEDAGIICDPCYKKITKDIEENPWKYPPLP